MKIAISSDGKDLQSNVDQRFGRAAYFIIYDTDTDQYDVVENTQNLQAAQGAGIQAAQNVVRQKVQLVISGNFGPKAFATLNAAGIKMAFRSSGNIRVAIDAARGGEIEYAKDANVEGHWT